MTEKKEADAKDTVKYVYNPVSLGILYFSFALSLWVSEQINDPKINAIAIILTIISLAFFIAVFSKWILRNLSKWVVKPLISLTFLAFFYGFINGWLQAFSQVSGIVLQVIAYFGFAWIIVILLIMIRDTVKTPDNKKNRLFFFIQFIRQYITYVIIAAFFIVAITKFLSHDFWSGLYMVVIAILSLSVARGWLKLNGSVEDYNRAKRLPSYGGNINVNNYLAKNGVFFGIFCLILGGGVLVAAVVLMFKDADTQVISNMIGLMLGLLSVGLGLIAISISIRSDQRYTIMLEKLDKNVTRLPTLLKNDILSPSGQLVVKETLTDKSKDDAQKRLDEDTQKVGYTRGELYQLPDGKWAIHWGGKYPL